MSWFEIAVIVLLCIVVIELACLMSAAGMLFSILQQGMRIEMFPAKEEDDADWWKGGDNDD